MPPKSQIAKPKAPKVNREIKFELPLNPDGTKNTNYVDVLDEYDSIPGQEYGCYAWISPEDIVQRREEFNFQTFVNQWEFSKTIGLYSDFLQFVSAKYGLQFNSLIKDFGEFVKEEETSLKIGNVTDDFATFMEKNHEQLGKMYNEKYGFQTSVRGFVNFGSFPTNEAARIQAEDIRSKHTSVTVTVCRNFRWVPLAPKEYQMGEIQYLEPELNKMHQEKIKNEARAKQEFEKRVFDAKKAQLTENIRLAEKTGNVLTQTMDETGKLINVRDITAADMLDREPAKETR